MRLLIALASLIACSAIAQPSTATLDEILVTGQRGVPAMWKVGKTVEEGEHALWIIGTAPPMRADQQWNSAQLENLMLHAEAVLFDSSFGIGVGTKGDMWRVLFVAPSLIGVRNNVDDLRLADVLPKDIYARWLVQKREYIGGDRGIEKFRPMFAADELESEALKKLRMGKFAVEGRIGSLARHFGVRRINPGVSIQLPLKGARATIKEFKRGSIDDLACFTETLEYVEALSDHEASRARFDAWSQGDVATLRRLPPLRLTNDCDTALASSSVAQKYAIGNIREQRNTAWLAAAEKALTENRLTIGILPLDNLLRADGRLELLRERGYTVTEPAE